MNGTGRNEKANRWKNNDTQCCEVQKSSQTANWTSKNKPKHNNSPANVLITSKTKVNICAQTRIKCETRMDKAAVQKWCKCLENRNCNVSFGEIYLQRKKRCTRMYYAREHRHVKTIFAQLEMEKKHATINVHWIDGGDQRRRQRQKKIPTLRHLSAKRRRTVFSLHSFCNGTQLKLALHTSDMVNCFWAQNDETKNQTQIGFVECRSLMWSYVVIRKWESKNDERNPF